MHFPLDYTSRSMNTTGSTSTECFPVGNIVHIVFCALVMLSGLPGNCLILRVYWAKPRKTTTHVLIMALACTDLTTCLLLVHALLSACIFDIGDTPTPMVILRYFLLSSVTVSVQITCMIAVDRYDCVCRSARRLLNYRRVLVLVLMAIIYSVSTTGIYFAVQVNHRDSTLIPLIMLSTQLVGYVIATLTNLICYGAVYRTIRDHVKVRISASVEAMPRQAVADSVPIEIFVTGSSAGNDDSSNMTDVLPDVGGARRVSFLDEVTERNSEPGPSTAAQNNRPTATDATSKRCAKKPSPQPSFSPRAPSTANLRQAAANPAPKASAVLLQRKITRMLLVTNVVFLLAWVPYWIYVGSLFATIAGVQIPDETAFLFEKLAYIEYLNSAVNPFIYGVANKRFRKDCKEVFQKWKYC